jgi:predicted RNase H-like nuclease (RuvC/YqgF family)
MKMKHIGILLLATVALGLFNGCVAPGGVDSLKITRNNIDWAMVHYNNRADFGYVTSHEKDQVAAAYTAYQTAFDAAFKQANSNLDAPTPTNVTQLANQLMVVLGSIP